MRERGRGYLADGVGLAVHAQLVPERLPHTQPRPQVMAMLHTRV